MLIIYSYGVYVIKDDNNNIKKDNWRKTVDGYFEFNNYMDVKPEKKLFGKVHI